jgi:uncharacterized repeat protein (TIGR01451 family)
LVWTSAVVDIVVTNPLPPALEVSIVSPANLSSFCQGQDLVINAVVTDAIGGAQVEFFVGGATLLGAATVSPYRITWPAPPSGTYSLTALATDGLGNAATSPAVEVVVAQQCGQVAIVRAIADPEIDTLRHYLFADMQFSSTVYDQQQLAALGPQALAIYDLVIWDGLGTSTNGLAAPTVDALYAAYTNGRPLYLMGERLASAGTTLPQPEQSEWTALTRLSAPSGAGGDGTVAVHSSDPSNPILYAGQFGTVSNFAYPARLDLATNVDANTEVIGTSGGADVLLACPASQASDTGQTRLFTQDTRVCPPDDPGSTNMLRALFENAAYWLLRGSWCVNNDVEVYPQADATPDPALAGSLLEYDVQVIRGGECPATGVVLTNVLPPGVQFFSARSAQGTICYDPAARQVTFSLGYLGLSSRPSLSLTVMPVAAGPLTNVFGVVLNRQFFNAIQVVTNVTEVLPGPDLTPTLGIRLLSPSQYELYLSGVTNVAYEIGSSPDLTTWTTVTNILGPDWEMLAAPTNTCSRWSLFYRAKVAP